MTSAQYRAACAKLGINIMQSGRVLGISERQAQRYAAGHQPVPEFIAKLLRCMIRLGTVEV
jgi:hypothetical protein